MVSRAFFVPGTVLLLCAFILSLLVSVTIPSVSDPSGSLIALDIARSHFDSNLPPPGSVGVAPSVNEFRVRHITPLFIPEPPRLTNFISSLVAQLGVL
jgi:hypothetical protein